MPEVYKLTLIGRDGQGNQWNNVLHYRATPGGGGASPWDEAGAFIDATAAQWVSSFLQLIPNDSELSFITARRVSAGGGQTAIRQFLLNGTEGSLEDVIGVGPMLRFITTAMGRGKQGRMFLPGLPVDSHLGNFLTAPYAAACTNFVGDLITPYTADGDTFVLTVFDRSTGADNEVIGGEVALKLGAQRKRMVPLF